MNDLRYAWRMLRKSPAFAITAVMTLGLAIGANTAVFSLVNAVMFAPLPYPAPERLALVSRTIMREGVVLEDGFSHTGRTWEAIRDEVRTADAAVWSGLSARVSFVTGDRALAVQPQRVSTGYFRVLGVLPTVGREFTPDEDRPGGPPAVILSDRLWRTALNGDPSVLGRTILLKGEGHAVVGIMPASFRSEIDADLWTPVRPTRTGEGEGTNYGIVLRVRDGASWAQVSADIAAAADLSTDDRERAAAAGMTVTYTAVPLQQGLASEVRQPLLLLWGAVALVLLVACINLAGLLLARVGSRTREIATRLAVGAGRRTIVRQLLVESLVIAILGGVTGLLIGALALEGLKVLAGDMLTAWGDVGLDGRVLALTVVLSVVTVLLFGLTPALHATRFDVGAALASGGTRSVAGGARGWPRRVLVVAEVALGVVLLVGAGLLIRTFVHLQSRPPGFDPQHLVAASASLEDARYADHEPVARLFDASLERMRAVPGVLSAAVSLGLPYERILNMGAERVGGDAAAAGSQYLFATATYVTPGYFETLRLPVRRGRSFTDFDTSAGAPVVVVNDTFARRYMDGEAVGQPVRFAGRTREIVGVVADVQQAAGFGDFGPIDVLPAIYVPFAQFQVSGLRVFHSWFSPAWIVRTTGPGAVTDRALGEAMADVDPQLPLAAVRPVDDVRRAALARQRALAVLVGALAVAALLLAAMGIHALIASGVAERMRELGIRLALGASPGSAIVTASTPGVLLALAGLAIGGAAAWGAAGLVRGLVWGVPEHDAVTFVSVAGVLLVVAVAASVVPALRVRRLDPARLLRE